MRKPATLVSGKMSWRLRPIRSFEFLRSHSLRKKFPQAVATAPTPDQPPRRFILPADQPHETHGLLNPKFSILARGVRIRGACPFGRTAFPIGALILDTEPPKPANRDVPRNSG